MKRHSSRSVLKRLGGETGTSLIEAALVTPLLLLLSFAVIDFALLFYVYLALGSGVGQATRYATTGQIVAGRDEGRIDQDGHEGRNPDPDAQ